MLTIGKLNICETFDNLKIAKLNTCEFEFLRVFHKFIENPYENQEKYDIINPENRKIEYPRNVKSFQSQNQITVKFYTF